MGRYASMQRVIVNGLREEPGTLGMRKALASILSYNGAILRTGSLGMQAGLASTSVYTPIGTFTGALGMQAALASVVMHNDLPVLTGALGMHAGLASAVIHHATYTRAGSLAMRAGIAGVGARTNTHTATGALGMQKALASAVVGPTTQALYAGGGQSEVGIGTVPWTNPGNISGPPDGTYAQALAVGNGSATNYLVSYLYGFSIPGGATIDGIQVDVTRRAGAGGGNCEDFSVTLTKGGSTIGNNKSIAGAWSTSPATITYGGAADLWGTSWTPTDINLSSGFGLAFVAACTSAPGVTPEVDAVLITVFYH